MSVPADARSGRRGSKTLEGGIHTLSEKCSSREGTPLIERRKIVSMWKSGGAVALATLINVQGSSYRGPGARILIGADGSHVGSVSGGCLEAEIVRKARWLTRNGPAIERYSTLFDDTSDMPYGLGCGGTVYVLLEPADTPEFTALMEALEASLLGQTRHIATTLPTGGQGLARQITDAEGGLVFSTPAQTSGEIYHERLDPPQRLFLFGAGDDAQPMVQMASLLGWSVFVFDGRLQLAKPERFPQAEAVQAAQQLGSLKPSTEDAVVLMTHSYEQDRDWLIDVLPCEPRYLGMLGSRHRSALLIKAAADALEWTVERACARLFSPVGLNLGGDGAEAIALAAVAEIQACTQGKLPHSRRMTPDMVAEQLDHGPTNVTQYLQAQCAL